MKQYQSIDSIDCTLICQKIKKFKKNCQTFEKFSAVSNKIQWPWKNYQAINGINNALISQTIQKTKKIIKLF